MPRSRRILLVTFTLLLHTLSGFAQDTLPDATIEDVGELSILLEPNDVETVLGTSGDQLNEDEAAKIAWESFASAYGIVGTPIGAGVAVMSEAGNVHFKNINDALTEIGAVMAVYQLYVDLNTGNTDVAAMNFTKNASLYAASKYGWQALRIATITISILDYALNTTATVVLGTRWANWEKAFIQYHDDKKRVGYRNIREWERVFVGLSKREGGATQDDIHRELDRYLNTFWEGDTSEYFQYKLQGEPPDKEKRAIKSRYMNERLVPYLTPLMDEMNFRARMALRIKANERAQSLRTELNASRTLQVQVIGPPERVSGLQVEIGPWEGVTDGEGRYDFNYTLWGYLNGGSPTSVEVLYPGSPADLVMHHEPEFQKPQEIVTFNATSTLKAIVIDKASGDPISGATVSVEGDGFDANGTSNTRGQVVIRNIPIGSHDVVVSAEGYRFTTERTDEFPPSDDISKPSVKTKRISLEPEEQKAVLATLKATVLDKSTGNPLSGAEVELKSETHSARGTSDGQGRVVIDNLPYGKYALTATRSQYEPLSAHSLNLTKEINSGKIRLKPEEKSVTPPPPPPPSPPPRTPPVLPPDGPCEYRELSSFNGSSGEDVLRKDISSDEHVFSGEGHLVSVPGPGTLQVSIRTTGRHEMANNEYGYMRFASKIVLSSPQGAVKDGSWISGGRFYPGVSDYGTNSHSWKVNTAGDISFQFVPERCYIREYKGEALCYVLGTTQLPGIKLLPTSYEMKVEFKPCQ